MNLCHRNKPLSQENHKGFFNHTATPHRPHQVVASQSQLV